FARALLAPRVRTLRRRGRHRARRLPRRRERRAAEADPAPRGEGRHEREAERGAHLPGRIVESASRRANLEAIPRVEEEARLEPGRGDHARSWRQVPEIMADREELEPRAGADDEMIPEDLLHADVDREAGVGERPTT